LQEKVEQHGFIGAWSRGEVRQVSVYLVIRLQVVHPEWTKQHCIDAAVALMDVGERSMWTYLKKLEEAPDPAEKEEGEEEENVSKKWWQTMQGHHPKVVSILHTPEAQEKAKEWIRKRRKQKGKPRMRVSDFMNYLNSVLLPEMLAAETEQQHEVTLASNPKEQPQQQQQNQHQEQKQDQDQEEQEESNSDLDYSDSEEEEEKEEKIAPAAPPVQSTKLKVSLETARLWLHRLGFDIVKISKQLYFDGHERAEVVEARKKYIKKMAELRSENMLLEKEPTEDEKKE